MTDLTPTPAIKATADDLPMISIPKGLFERVVDRLNTAQIFPLSAELRRAALATPAIQAVAPILTFQQRMNDCPDFKGVRSKEHMFDYALAEIADLRAALAAVPAQQPIDSEPSEREAVAACLGGDTCATCGNETLRICAHCKPDPQFAVDVRVAPAAPVAPDLTRQVKALPSMCWWHADGHPVFNNMNGDDLILRKDVERLLSHPAHAQVEPSKELTGREIRYLLDKHAEAAIDVHEHGDTGGFCVALESAEQAIFAAISNPVEPVSALTDERITFENEWKMLTRPKIQNYSIDAHGDYCYRELFMAWRMWQKRALLAASPKVGPVSEDKRDAETGESNG